MHLATIAAVTLCAFSTACTIVVQAAPIDEAGESTSAAASSFPELADESSSTGESEVDSSSSSSSTGHEIASNGTVELDVDDETSTGDWTTSDATSTSVGEDTTSSSTTHLSTSGDTADETTGSTTDVALGLMGGPCSLDSDCESGVCIGGGFNGESQPRCSTACPVESATDCLDLGSPGLCTWGGGDQHWCTGVWSFGPQDIRIATPDPDVDYLYYQSGGFLPTAADRHAYLVPPQQVAFNVELASIDEPGYGDGAVDVFGSDGTLIGSVVVGESQSVTIEPKGIHHYHWLIVRPNDGKKVSYQLWLKESCWPNC